MLPGVFSVGTVPPHSRKVGAQRNRRHRRLVHGRHGSRPHRAGNMNCGAEVGSGIDARNHQVRRLVRVQPTQTHDHTGGRRGRHRMVLFTPGAETDRAQGHGSPAATVVAIRGHHLDPMPGSPQSLAQNLNAGSVDAIIIG